MRDPLTVVVDDFEQGAQKTLRVGRCPCGAEGVLIHGVCLACFEAARPWLWEVGHAR